VSYAHEKTKGISIWDLLYIRKLASGCSIQWLRLFIQIDPSDQAPPFLKTETEPVSETLCFKKTKKIDKV
jgi:hypothetical protein